MINGINISIDREAIRLSGTLLGSTQPRIESLSTDNRLRLHSKVMQVSQTISASGNNKFYMPISFGDNKCIISVDGVYFFPDVDYKIDGSEVEWLNPGFSISTDAQVIVWGPANSYTAQALEIYKFNQVSEFFDTGDGFLQARNMVNNNRFPYNELSTFLVVNGLPYSPTLDYEYSEPDNVPTFTWVGGEGILDESSQCFAFWFNKITTTPYVLGDKLMRLILTAGSNNQEQFFISAIPDKNMAPASILTYDTVRYAYNHDFFLRFPYLQIIDDSTLMSLIATGGKLDLAYIKDANAFFSIILQYMSIHIDSNNTSTVEGNKVISLPSPTSSPVTNTKELVFLNGILAIGQYYDNGSFDSINDSPIFTGPEYTRNQSSITWKVTNRYDEVNEEYLIPIPEPYNPPGQPDNWYMSFLAFIDSLSQNHLRKDYFQRTNADSTAVFEIELPNLKGNKFIVFYNGAAMFKDSNDFLFVPASDPDPAKIKYFGSGTVEGDRLPPPEPDEHWDEIVVLYPTDDAYSGLWFFDKEVLSGDVGPEESITFDNNIVNVQYSLLFKNSEYIPNHFYYLDDENPKRILFKSLEDLGFQDAPEQLQFQSGDIMTLVHL